MGTDLSCIENFELVSGSEEEWFTYDSADTRHRDGFKLLISILGWYELDYLSVRQLHPRLVLSEILFTDIERATCQLSSSDVAVMCEKLSMIKQCIHVR